MLFSQMLSILHRWSELHHYNRTSGCSCTSLATYPNIPDFVSAGEDGRIVVLRMDHERPVRNIGRKYIFTPALRYSEFA